MSRVLFGLAIVCVGLAANDRGDPASESAQKERLAALQQLVGSWRGVAQPQRGSTKDSWIEEAEWIWSFGSEGPALVAKLPKSKYFKQLKLLAGKEISDTLVGVVALAFNGLSFSVMEHDLRRVLRQAVISDQPIETPLRELVRDHAKRLPLHDRKLMALALQRAGLSQRETSEWTGVHRHTIRTATKRQGDGEKRRQHPTD